MIYHPIKVSCKKIGSSVDMADTVISDCRSKPLFLHYTLAHDDTSPYKVWLQKVQQLRRYYPEKHSLEFWSLPVTLTLTTTERCNLFHKTYNGVPSNQVWQQKNQQFRRYNRNCHILIIWTLAVTLTLKTANQSFCMTLWLMMHHNVKFGNKMFGGFEDIIWTNTDI